jgi:hypothetical protein
VASDEHLHDVEHALWIGLIADRERRPLQCCAYLNGNVDAILQPDMSPTGPACARTARISSTIAWWTAPCSPISSQTIDRDHQNIALEALHATYSDEAQDRLPA